MFSEKGRPVRRTRLASAADENGDEFAESPMAGRPASAPGNFAKGLEHGPIPRGLLFPYDIRVGDDFQVRNLCHCLRPFYTQVSVLHHPAPAGRVFY